MASKCAFPLIDFAFPSLPPLPSIPFPDLDFSFDLNLVCPLD